MQKRTKFQIRSDASKQRWVRDDRKESFWRKHLEAWKVSGESKRGYCISHNLTQSSFNAWNREIELRDREKVSSANAKALLTHTAETPKNPFVPLRLLPDDEKEPEPRLPIVEPAPVTQLIDILVPGGAVIRVDENCSLKFVAELFSTLKVKG
jgi:hypothetical protein